MPISDEDRAYVRSRLGGTSAPSQDSDQGFFGRTADYFGRLSDKFDPNWFPDEDVNKDYPAADYVYNKVSRPVGAALKGAMRTGRWIGDAAFGGPVRTATTLATFGTGPAAGAVIKGLGSAPKLQKAVTLGAKTLHNVNRGADALQAVTQGAQAAGNISEGNYGQAAANIGFGYLGARGAREKFASRPVARGINAPVTPTPAAPTKSAEELFVESVHAVGKKPLSAAKTARIPQASRELQVLGIDPTPENVRKHLNQRADAINEATRRANAIQPGVSVEHITPPATHEVGRRVVRQNLKEAGIDPTKENIDWVIAQRNRLNDAAAKLAEARKNGQTSTISGTLAAGESLGDGPTSTAIASLANPSVYQRMKDGVKGTFVSMEEEWRKMGEPGKEVANMFVRARTDAKLRYHGYVGDIVDDLDAIMKGKHKDVSSEDFAKVVDRVKGDTTVKLTDAQEDLAKRIRGALGKAQADMHERGLITDVKDTYFPEKYISDIKTARQELRAKGWSKDQITAELQQRAAKSKGFIGMEKKPRGLEGARTDPKVLIEELRDVAHRVERVDNFGADYLADGSKLMNAINATSNPLRAKDLADRVLKNSRQVSDDSKGLTNAIKAYATASALSQTAISQIGGTVPILARNSLKNAIGSIGDAFRKDSNYAFLRNANGFQDFSSHFDDNSVGESLYKYFGIQGMQNAMNHWAGRTGLATAKTLLSKLKIDPNNETARKQLQDLILDDIEGVLKQDNLTEKQMQRAMARMAEITQGSPDQEKLPYHWVGSGFRQLPQIFARMGFQGTKAIKDGWKQNPLGVSGKVVGSGLLAGELIGDLKEIPRTLGETWASNVGQGLDLTGDNRDFFPEYWENIGGKSLTGALTGTEGLGEKPDDTQDRFAYTRRMIKEAMGPEAAKNDLFVRAMSNVLNSYTFGMLSDSVIGGADIGNSRDPLAAALSSLWIGDEAKTALDVGRDLLKGNVRDPTREVVRRIPFFGSGANRVIPTNREKEKGLDAGKGTYGSSGGGGKYTITYKGKRK